ncbi:MAG: sigma-B regulation protein RsbU (phosphoserine phosphatase) [Parvicella sp.]|jgi:sigma-B regulation protein RsbU (phosphoserine phosphatase)
MESRVGRLLERIELKEFKLTSLLEVTRAINENFSTEKLLTIYQYILRDQLGISKLLLFNYDQKKWNSLLKYGVKGKARKINVEEHLTNIKDITVIESSASDSLNSFDIVIPVYHKNSPLAYLLLGDLNEDALNISPTIKHMPFIQTLTNIIMVAIENKRFAKESIEQELAKKELELAAEMQKMLFPSELPSNNRIQVAARFEAKQMVGGDYYDFIQLNNEEYVICIADVSGKGVSAALLMSNFQAHLRAIIKHNHSSMTIEELVVDLNESVNSAAQGEKFITFFLGYYNSTNHILKYINAGHNYPILTDGKNARFLNKGCVGLGMFDEIPRIEVEEILIKKNDTLICFTDGVVELENEEEEAFDDERLVEIIHQNFDASMSELDAIVFRELEKFKGSKDYLDDTALISCRFF